MDWRPTPYSLSDVCTGAAGSSMDARWQPFALRQLAHANAYNGYNGYNGLRGQERRGKIVDAALLSEANSTTFEAIPPHPATLAACSPVAQAGVAMWLAGPPGAGKSTLVLRLRRYGFMAVDCEDHWTWRSYCKLARRVNASARCTCERCSHGVNGWLMVQATHAAFRESSPLAIGACAEQFLLLAPKHAVPVVLLPEYGLYRERWRSRNAKDDQPHEQRYKASLHVLDRLRNVSRGILHVLQDSSNDMCIDASLIELCNGVMRLLMAHPTLLCFYCRRQRGRSPPASLQAACQSLCRDRGEIA